MAVSNTESYSHLPRPPPPQPITRPSPSRLRTTGIRIPPSRSRPLIPPWMSNTSNRRAHPLPLPPLQRYPHFHPPPFPLPRPPPPPPPVTRIRPSYPIRPSSLPVPSSLISNWGYIDPEVRRRKRDSAAKEKLMILDRKMTRELMSSSTSSPCAVCLENLELDQTMKKMPCKHIFHSGCISTCLDSHHTCPVCRYKL